MACQHELAYRGGIGSSFSPIWDSVPLVVLVVNSESRCVSPSYRKRILVAYVWRRQFDNLKFTCDDESVWSLHTLTVFIHSFIHSRHQSSDKRRSGMRVRH